MNIHSVAILSSLIMLISNIENNVCIVCTSTVAVVMLEENAVVCSLSLNP